MPKNIIIMLAEQIFSSLVQKRQTKQNKQTNKQKQKTFIKKIKK